MFNNLLIAAADLNRISLASWDWIVIAIFFLAMVWICWDVSRKKKETSGDYFLSGRSATWIAIGASIFASNIGSEHLIGLAGTGASAGMAQAHWEIQGWMILILGWVFVPFYERSMVYTMPEFLEKRYNKESRGILTWLSLASYVLTKVSVTVLAGGLALNTLLGINFWVAALALVIITAIYTVIGGMESVLKTSVLQTPILLIGSLVILWLGLKELGGWNAMMDICGAQPVNDLGDTMTDLMRSGKDPEFPWYGALFGSAIIGFWYWCTDQFIVQRVLVPVPHPRHDRLRAHQDPGFRHRTAARGRPWPPGRRNRLQPGHRLPDARQHPPAGGPEGRGDLRYPRRPHELPRLPVQLLRDAVHHRHLQAQAPGDR